MTAPAGQRVAGAGATIVRGLVFAIQLYRHMVSPLRPPTCRFMPTCSQYAVEALTEYGLFRGSWLAVIRLAKCGPWHRGGWDPIPERAPVERGGRVIGADTSAVGDAPAPRGESGSFV
ncbi:membrane protein insertion efficiency factor YidD [Mycobacterium sherrisii]|uniref:membrane protein insertion efficiency factor YidD n=1 Tax=Mycobacterium sherrisii TaxID=243061 RepID=UPI0011546A04|nr:membrane protein insertion efficiency factor YidD [Mycobacterium sherrisii]MCV7029373.1 membrane protein insertion efficiency factor YidD [Mycobacterium sherrisii]MEC4761513.1 membrane protein insertion efficiency factor YidD [Mycobacterium sherrisii]